MQRLVHDIIAWQGIELVIRSDSVDQGSVDWMAGSLFWKYFEETPISADDAVLDLGAHIGSFGVLAASRRNCNVFAIEPDLESFTLCRINALLNSVEGKVVSLRAAVGGETGKLLLFEATENWGHTILQGGGPYNILTGRNAEVDCYSLRDILVHIGCDRCAFVKLNIEGAEFDLIEKSSTETLQKIGTIVGEVHYDLVSRSTNGILSRLREAGFRVELVPMNENRAVLLARR